jgi:hypothetical protein
MSKKIDWAEVGALQGKTSGYMQVLKVLPFDNVMKVIREMSIAEQHCIYNYECLYYAADSSRVRIAFDISKGRTPNKIFNDLWHRQTSLKGHSELMYIFGAKAFENFKRTYRRKFTCL